MKNNKGTTLLVIGMMFTALGTTIFSNNDFLKFTGLILGVLFSVYSVFVSDKFRKENKENS